MGVILDKASVKAISDEIRPQIDSAVEARVKAGTEAAIKPLVDRITDLETKTRERPDFTGTTPEGRKLFRGHEVRSLYGENGAYQGAFGIPDIASKAHEYRFFRLFRGMKTGNWAGCEFERDIMQETMRQKAALGLSDDSGVGAYIPNEVMTTIIDPLRATSVKNQLGMQMLTGLTASPIQFPRQVGVETAYWVEGQGVDAITESEQTGDQVILSPHMVGVLTAASLSLIQKAPSVIENRIRRSITRTLELKEDAALFQGTGNGQPLGLANVSGALTVSLSGHAASTVFPMLQKFIAQLESNNVEITGGKFAMHALAWHTLWNNQLTQIAAGNHMTFLTIGTDANGRPTKFLFGYPVVICNSITASTTTKIFFCNWPEIMWASWFNPGIAFSDVADDAFKKVKGYYRIVEEVDLAQEHPESVCISSTDLTYVTF